MNKFTSKPIPVISDPENCDNRDFIDSPLVEIKPNEKIIVDMQYPVLGFENGEKRCLARKEVAEMLYKAADLLPDGYKFVIWDAWRPFALQKELFISYSEKIIKEFHLEDKTKEEQELISPDSYRTTVRVNSKKDVNRKISNAIMQEYLKIKCSLF